MSKITFRADDELVRRLEAFDASKSEVMREALRAHLDDADGSPEGSSDDGAEPDADDSSAGREEPLDDLLAERVDELVAERLADAFTRAEPQDVNVNITLSGDSVDVARQQAGAGKTDSAESARSEDARANEAKAERTTCKQCGEALSDGTVYCPNCGEKAAHRVFCECGDELRSDWAFCPGCGRRTPAADVLRDS